jgi:hypothetical protein
MHNGRDRTRQVAYREGEASRVEERETGARLLNVDFTVISVSLSSNGLELHLLSTIDGSEDMMAESVRKAQAATPRGKSETQTRLLGDVEKPEVLTCDP